MLEITKIDFASSVNIGKDNFEAKSIDITRKEFRHYKMFYDYENQIYLILNTDPILNNPALEHKKINIVHPANVKFSRPKSLGGLKKKFEQLEAKKSAKKGK